MVLVQLGCHRNPASLATVIQPGVGSNLEGRSFSEVVGGSPLVGTGGGGPWWGREVKISITAGKETLSLEKVNMKMQLVVSWIEAFDRIRGKCSS